MSSRGDGGGYCLKRLEIASGIYDITSFDQAQLAKKAGVTQQVLSRYEYNEHEMSVGIAMRSARALGLSMDVLTGFWEHDPDDERTLMPPRGAP